MPEREGLRHYSQAMTKIELTQYQARILSKGPWNPEDQVYIASISQDGDNLVVELRHRCVGRWTRTIPPGRPARPREPYTDPVVVHVRSGKVYHPQCGIRPIEANAREYPDKQAAAADGYTDECRNCIDRLTCQPFSEPEPEPDADDFPESPWWSHARNTDEWQQLVQRLEHEVAEMLRRQERMEESPARDAGEDYLLDQAIYDMTEFLRRLRHKRVPRVVKWRRLWVCMEQE